MKDKDKKTGTHKTGINAWTVKRLRKTTVRKYHLIEAELFLGRDKKYSFDELAEMGASLLRKKFNLN